MSETLILLAPLLVLLIMVLFGFAGCSELAEADRWPDEKTREEEPQGPKYAELVESTPGFVAHWPMNESAGETIATGLGPPNVDGVYMPGATPGSPGALANKDPQNFAPSLDGTNGYVEVPFSPLLNVQGGPGGGLPFSVEVWVKPSLVLPEGEEEIVISSHHISVDSNHRGYEIALMGTAAASHATVRGRVFTIDLPFVTNVDITPTQGDPLEWRHIVMTHSGSGALGNVIGLHLSVAGIPGTMYNDEENADYREVQAGGNGERALRFGAGHQQAGEPEKFFKGLIDEVAFYDGVLDKVYVEQHFQAF